MTELGLADKILRLHAGLQRARIPHAFGGALALAYYGTPRATVDIDVNVFISTDAYRSLASVLRRLRVKDVPERMPASPEGQVRIWWDSTPADFFFSYDEVHDAMQAAIRNVPFGDKTITILAPEHLLVAKAVFDRPKDWIDIEQVLIAVDDFDVEEVRRWLVHIAGESDSRTKRFLKLASELRDTD